MWERDFKPLSKYVKSKSKIHKNFSTVKIKKKSELTDTLIATVGLLARFFFFSICFFSPSQKSYEKFMKKILDEQIRAKGIKLLLSKLDVNMGPVWNTS